MVSNGGVSMGKLLIAATPTLKGKDVEKLIQDIKRKATKSAISRMERTKRALELARK